MEHAAQLILQRKVSPNVKEKGINGVLWPLGNNSVESLAPVKNISDLPILLRRVECLVS